MKNRFIFVTLAAIIALVSCQSIIIEQAESEGLVFTASISPETKTYLDWSKGKVEWLSGDEITITDGVNTAIYELSSIKDGNRGFFTKKSGDDLKTSGVTYTATYGVSPMTSQTYSYAPYDLPMTAISNTTSLQFTVSCGLLRIQLLKLGESIKSITVTGTPEGGKETSYTLECNPAVGLDRWEQFFIALPAGSYDKFVFTDADDKVCTLNAKEGKAVKIETNKTQPITFSDVLYFAGDTRPEFATLSFRSLLYGSAGDVKNIKQLKIHTESDVKSGTRVTIDVPVYYEISSTNLDIYTPAKMIKPSEEFILYDLPSLETIDLTKVDFSEFKNFNFMFSGMTHLKSVIFGNTAKPVAMRGMFNGCTALETLDLSGLDVSQVENFEMVFKNCRSLKKLDLSTWNTKSAKLMNEMFSGCWALEQLDISSFNTKQVTEMGSMFFECKSLKLLDLTSFNTSKLELMSIMFNSCTSMEYLDLSTFNIPATCDVFNAIALLGSDSSECVVKCSPDTYVTLLDSQGYEPDGITWLYTSPFEIYESKSYAKDGTFVKLQSATVGNGIDLVIMADGFSDRMIDSGEYDTAVNQAVKAIFSQDPFKSYRDFFNVYEVKVVSKNEYLFLDTALEVAGNMVFGGNDATVIEYARKALGETCSFDNVTIGVIANTKNGGGTTNIPISSGTKVNDYGIGQGIAYVGIGTSITSDSFKNTFTHEFVGHGFAKLDDEYFPADGTASSAYAAEHKEQCEKYGYWKNVDFTGNTSKIRWSKFIFDSRYASENIGAYEGASYATYGAWRPTYNSVMNNMNPQDPKFNAPSREAIYYRINKLAYGEDWEYDYETFVKFDLKL